MSRLATDPTAVEEVTVRILDRDYRLSCQATEKPVLMAAVARVDAGMRAIRGQGKVSGVERIAVFAALNIASERPVATTAPAPSSDAVADEEILRRMRAIDALLDTALASQEKLF